MHHDAWIANRLVWSKSQENLWKVRLNSEEENAAFDATWNNGVHLRYMNTPANKQPLLYKIYILYSLRNWMLCSH